MTDHSKLKMILEGKLRALLERASDIEGILSDPGNSDSEENAIEIDESLSAIGEVTKREIEGIKLALNRIESGHYGICVNCGKPIGRERLDAIPYISTCIRCA
jgi:DnaK suppressor protein